MNSPHRLLAASVSFLFASVHASAATFGNFTYVDNGANITITGCANVTGAVDIPASIDGKPVVEIGREAFKSRSGITGVTIPDSVVTIGYDAFGYCDWLAAIDIPSSVTSLGTGVFRHCRSLQIVSLPVGLTVIPDFAFESCAALQNISIPAGTKSLGNNAFFYCLNLQSVTLPSGLTSIGNSAFSYCRSLTTVQVPDSVTYLGTYAFSSSGLTSVRLAEGLKELRYGLFSGCISLEVIELPPTVEVLRSECFRNCSNLRRVILPASLRQIDMGAFGDCTALKQVRFPLGLKRIHNSIFMYSGVEKAYFAGPAPKLVDGDEFYEVPKTFQSFFVDGKKSLTWPEWGGFPATPLGPEIMVSAPHDIPIATRISTQSFGARVEGYKRRKTFTIRNIGTKKLKGLSTSVLNNPDGDFTCTPPLRKSLEPGESTVFRVVFQPVDDGRRDAILRIRSNDANEDPVTIKVHGLGMK